MKVLCNYHKKGHKCSFKACNRGLVRILPKQLVFSLGTPILLHEKMGKSA